jgi:hypothetical protein
MVGDEDILHATRSKNPSTEASPMALGKKHRGNYFTDILGNQGGK